MLIWYLGQQTILTISLLDFHFLSHISAGLIVTISLSLKAPSTSSKILNPKKKTYKLQMDENYVRLSVPDKYS